MAAGVDLLAVETIPTVREAGVLIGLIAESGAPAWLSYTGRDDGMTAAGEPFEEAIAVANDGPGVVAVGVNCTAPRHVPGLLAIARTATTKPLIAYPNRGDRWDASARAWQTATEDAWDAAEVASWTAFGAAWLGGCCGTGPDDIGRLAGVLA